MVMYMCYRWCNLVDDDYTEGWLYLYQVMPRGSRETHCSMLTFVDPEVGKLQAVSGSCNRRTCSTWTVWWD